MGFFEHFEIYYSLDVSYPAFYSRSVVNGNIQKWLQPEVPDVHALLSSLRLCLTIWYLLLSANKLISRIEAMHAPLIILIVVLNNYSRRTTTFFADTPASSVSKASCIYTPRHVSAAHWVR